MSYCTNAHVAGEFKNITFNSTSSVTDTEVDRFIEEADAYINGRLSKRYETPITGTEALLIVRTISTKLVAGRVQQIIKVKTGDEATRQDGQSGSLASEGKQMLKDIVADDLRLTDATAVSTHQGIRSYNTDEGITHNFEVGVDQW